MYITVIHPARNEHTEIVATVESMKSAFADEILVFDDGSDTPLPYVDADVTSFNSSIGPSVCRNLGGNNAIGDVLVFADAHTRIDNLIPICQFALDNKCIVIPTMTSLYGAGNTIGYSRDFILKGKSNELIGFNMTNYRPNDQYSYCYGNWGGFFVMSKKVFDEINGWVDHKYWGYNDPSLILKGYMHNIPTILDTSTMYKHKGKVKTGFGYPVKSIEPLLNIFHTYYVCFTDHTFENHWLPLLEKEHKWMYAKGLEHISNDKIKMEKNKFQNSRQQDDSYFFDVFMKQKNSRQKYINV